MDHTREDFKNAAKIHGLYHCLEETPMELEVVDLTKKVPEIDKCSYKLSSNFAYGCEGYSNN